MTRTLLVAFATLWATGCHQPAFQRFQQPVCLEITLDMQAVEEHVQSQVTTGDQVIFALRVIGEITGHRSSQPLTGGTKVLLGYKLELHDGKNLVICESTAIKDGLELQLQHPKKILNYHIPVTYAQLQQNARFTFSPQAGLVPKR